MVNDKEGWPVCKLKGPAPTAFLQTLSLHTHACIPAEVPAAIARAEHACRTWFQGATSVPLSALDVLQEYKDDWDVTSDEVLKHCMKSLTGMSG